MDFLLGVVLDLRAPQWKECVTDVLPARSCAGFEGSSVEGVCNIWITC
jgi:hypothetical protein